MNLTRKHEFDVVGIGNALVDVMARSGEDTIEEFGLPKGAMSLVGLDFVQQATSKITPESYISGGSVANTCVGLASLGAKAGFIGRIAKDDFGKAFDGDITKAGVTFRHKAAHRPHDSGDATGRCYIFVTPDAERTMATFLGVAGQLTEVDIDTSLIENAMVTYLEGYLWDLDRTKDALKHAMTATHQAGHLVALSLSDPYVVERHRDELQELIEGASSPSDSSGVYVDIVFGNEEEVSLLYKDSFSKAAERIASNNVLAALTRGAKGSLILFGDESVTIESKKLSGVVDTTGAGDLYAAGFLFGLTRQVRGYSDLTLRQSLDHVNLEQSGMLGNLAAAEIISHMGSRPKVSLAKLAKSEGLIS
jgi:sugar/nucleoside kinase (ribokinase family)